jgi:hypothetical protein
MSATFHLHTFRGQGTGQRQVDIALVVDLPFIATVIFFDCDAKRLASMFSLVVATNSKAGDTKDTSW